MDFQNKVSQAWHKNNSLLCVGLDPNPAHFPSIYAGKDSEIITFNKSIIDATADVVCAYKINTAFYEAYGVSGLQDLFDTVIYLKNNYPHLPIIIDAKRADIGNTNNGTVRYVFDHLQADAITVNPYLGREAVEPFLERREKGIIVLCRTSNPGAKEFQDLSVQQKPLYQVVAEHVSNDWNIHKNCSLVVGATFPEEIIHIRKIVGDEMILLIPGVGVQGGDIDRTLSAGLNSNAEGVIINSSRGVIYASKGDDYIEAARKAAVFLRDQINDKRSKA